MKVMKTPSRQSCVKPRFSFLLNSIPLPCRLRRSGQTGSVPQQLWVAATLPSPPDPRHRDSPNGAEPTASFLILAHFKGKA